MRDDDSVGYKCQGENKLRVPGDVIGRDGKLVLVRHKQCGTYLKA